LYLFRLPFPGTDDLAYKQAGVNFFRGLGFCAPGLIGAVPGIEKHFLRYPPLYPFIYGVWFFLFGFSLSASLFLSYLICGFITFKQCQLFEVIAKRKAPLYIYGLIFFSWTIALKEISRPDPLLTLFVLTLLKLLINELPKGLTLRIKISIILLVGLSLVTSIVLGILSLIYIYFVFVSVRGFSIRTTRDFIILFACGFAFCILIWWLAGHSSLYLFRSQLIHPYYRRLFSIRYPLLFSLAIINHFKFAFTLFYLPLIIFLIYAAVRNIILERDRIKKSFLYWQFSGIIIVWLILITVAPQQYTYFQVFYTIFITGVVFQITAEFFEKPKIKRIFYLCLFISYLPFFKTTLLIPLTWEKQDTYEYNKKLILAEVPAGSRVTTDARFWYLFDKNYAVFDLRKFQSHITGPWDYVLLASGGSGKPDAPLVHLGYFGLYSFKQYFVKQLGTMSNQPNRLFGIFPISKSRWCYRFELYKRR
jgi:hypothetical protein